MSASFLLSQETEQIILSLNITVEAFERITVLYRITYGTTWPAGPARATRATRATRAAAAVAGVDTATLLVVGSRGVAVRVVGSGVNTDDNESQKTVSKVVTEENVVDKRVVVSSSLAASNTVIGGEGKLLGVADVRLGLLNLSDELLVEKDLTNVVSLADNIGLVGQNGRVLADEKVDVVGTSLVVTGEDGVELNDTITVGLLNTTEERGVQTTLGLARNTRVYAISTAVPDIDKRIGNWAVSGNVKELKVQVDGDTGVIFDDVNTDELAGDEVRSNGDLRGKT
jgi:hypothetical protein